MKCSNGFIVTHDSWFSSLSTGEYSIGIVLGHNDQEDKAYIGVAGSKHHASDVDNVACWGGPFPLETAYKLFGVTKAEAIGKDDSGLPTVGGRRMNRSNEDFERACLVLIGEEQRGLNPNNALIAVLCDSVRLSREACDMATTPMVTADSKPITEEQRQATLLALAQLAHRRPGWDVMLGEIADSLQGRAMFDKFKETSA